MKISILSGLAAVLALTGSADSAEAVAFVDVTVIPMDTERALPGQTVIVKGDRITEVGPKDKVAVPADARRIDGAGQFLIPGLAEMHAHNPPAGAPVEQFETNFFLFVANGVTTARSMLGHDGQLAWKEKARSGGLVAPTLYLAGPSFSGGEMTPDQAMQRVKAQKAEGWDLLKVHPGLKVETYEAMAKTAKEVGIEFSGHIPADVGLVRAIDLGQRTVDHLDGYIEHLQAQDAPVEPAKLAEIVKKTRDSGTWVVPTMMLWETIIGAAKAEELEALPELKYTPRQTVQSWRVSYRRKAFAPDFSAQRAKQIADNRKVLLKALADGGVRILFGTDAPQQYSVPGFSIHREMRAMKEAGMSNFAILQSATKNAGDYYEAVDKVGQVAPGHRADLVLLSDNPLRGVENVAKRVGVMVRGRWIPEAAIQARLAQIAESAAK